VAGQQWLGKKPAMLTKMSLLDCKKYISWLGKKQQPGQIKYHHME